MLARFHFTRAVRHYDLMRTCSAPQMMPMTKFTSRVYNRSVRIFIKKILQGARSCRRDNMCAVAQAELLSEVCFKLDVNPMDVSMEIDNIIECREALKVSD